MSVDRKTDPPPAPDDVLLAAIRELQAALANFGALLGEVRREMSQVCLAMQAHEWSTEQLEKRVERLEHDTAVFRQ